MAPQFALSGSCCRSIQTGLVAAVVALAIGCGGSAGSSSAQSGAVATVGLSAPGSLGKQMIGTLSADGSTIAASVPFNGDWYVWTRAGGWKDTKLVSAVSVTGAPTLSSDGKSFLINAVDGPYVYSNGSAAHLPPYGVETTPTAFSFSADGTRILGSTTYSGTQPAAGNLIEWTNLGTPVAIPGPLPVGAGSIGYLTVTGFALDGVSPVGYTNVFDLGIPPLGGLPELEYSSTLYWSIQNGGETDTANLRLEPSAVSPNGRTFAGASANGGVVWNPTGTTSHTFAIASPANVDVSASAVSDAGDVVAGIFLSHAGVATPWIWTAVKGERLATDVINANGLAPSLRGYTLKSIFGMSADGTTILFDAANASGADSLALVHLGNN